MKRILPLKFVSVSYFSFIYDYISKRCSCLLHDDLLIQVLVVDDGSTDRTADIGVEYGRKYNGVVRVIKLEKNLGKGKVYTPLINSSLFKCVFS